MKRIILAGGTGFLGTVLRRTLKNRYKFIILTRGKDQVKDNETFLHWDGKTRGEWTKWIEDADIVINLNGKSVDCRYSQKNKREIYSSRIDSTSILGEVMSSSRNPPALWINASSATIYRDSRDIEMDEKSGVHGSGFSVDVCEKWEAAFDQFQLPNTRKILIRTGIVLGRQGGPYQTLASLVRLGLGGKQGDGGQFVSWLHEDDFVQVIERMIENNNMTGIYNVTAPHPVTNREFMYDFRKSKNKSFGLDSPEWMLEIGAFFIRTETELVLKSRKVVPKRLTDEGYTFIYPTISACLTELSESYK